MLVVRSSAHGEHKPQGVPQLLFLTKKGQKKGQIQPAFFVKQAYFCSNFVPEYTSRYHSSVKTGARDVGRFLILGFVLESHG